MNRIATAIAAAQPKIAGLTEAARIELDAAMDITAEEHFAYQQAQSQAHAMGTLTTEEAQIAYWALGESMSSTNGGWTRDTDLATKVVVTRLVGELLSKRLGR